jgi:[acyl-carrier-protein] S-malonyltransferase
LSHRISDNGKVAFLFPGQGSQYVGMGKDLYDHFKVARETFEEAEEAACSRISKLCFEGPWEDLKLTINTQPAILAVSIAALRVLQSETGCRPFVLAGHSLGEYSALVAAGAMEFADAVRTVCYRGRFMQEAVPLGEGGLAVVVGCDEARLRRVCEEASEGEVVALANFNCPGQVVLSGHLGAVRRAVALAREHGSKGASVLPVSAPIHSPLMESAGTKLAEFLRAVTVMEAKIPVVSNVDARPHTSGSEIKKLLVQHLSVPVRWEESMRTIISQFAVRNFVEIGPGKVLSGLFKWIDPSVALANVEDSRSLERARNNVKQVSAEAEVKGAAAFAY